MSVHVEEQALVLKYSPNEMTVTCISVISLSVKVVFTHC